MSRILTNDIIIYLEVKLVRVCGYGRSGGRVAVGRLHRGYILGGAVALVAGDLQRGRRGRVAVPRRVLLGLVAGLGAGLVAARHVQHADHGVGGALARLLPRRHQAPVPVVVRHRRDREALQSK